MLTYKIVRSATGVYHSQLCQGADCNSRMKVKPAAKAQAEKARRESFCDKCFPVDKPDLSLYCWKD